MTSPLLRNLILCLLPAWAFVGQGSTTEAAASTGKPAMDVYYLEIVTKEVDETCAALAKLHGVEFSDPIPEFGNAYTAPLKTGGMLSVRAPLRPDEGPVVRPYLLVEDIEAAVKTAGEAGAQIAIPAMEIPGRGKFSIYILGGIEHGLWQK